MKTNTPRDEIAGEREVGRAAPHRRRRWSWEAKLEILARWEASGLGRMAFCRREGLGYGNLLNWLRRRTAANVAQAHAPAQGVGGGGLLEVRLSEGVSEGGARMEVLAPNGWRVRLGDEFGGETLEKVLALVGRMPALNATNMDAGAMRLAGPGDLSGRC